LQNRTYLISSFSIRAEFGHPETCGKSIYVVRPVRQCRVAQATEQLESHTGILGSARTSASWTLIENECERLGVFVQIPNCGFASLDIGDAGADRQQAKVCFFHRF
jgi:hypothetical protein